MKKSAHWCQITMSGETDNEGSYQDWLRREHQKVVNPVRVAAPRTVWVLPAGFSMISSAGNKKK